MTYLSSRLATLGVAVVLALVAGACADLSVDNLTAPDTEEVLANPDDVKNLLSGAYLTWWQTSTSVDGWFALMTAGDQFSSSWGNFGMRALSSEPREAYNNSLTAVGDVRAITEEPWYGYYSALASANDVLRQIAEGTVIEEEDGTDITEVVKASAYLLQGLTLGYIGVIFDQGYIIDEDSDPAVQAEFAPYPEVIAAAVQKLELAKQAADAAPDGATMPANYINGLELTMSEMQQLANSFAARLLVWQARTPGETDDVDWNAVAQYARNGVDWDFAPEGDDNFWFDYLLLYGHLEVWIRLDQRVVNMFDDQQPVPYPDQTSVVDSARSADARLAAYYDYTTEIAFRPERGYYHFSHYFRTRFGYHNWTASVGPMPFLLARENDMMLAEALVRSGGSEAEAADLLNRTRVTNGGLPALTADDDLLHATFYERFAELDFAAPGQGYFDRRRTDVDGFELQPGTPRQFPVPAEELNILDMELYTFGGSGSGGGNLMGKTGEPTYTVLLHPKKKALKTVDQLAPPGVR